VSGQAIGQAIEVRCQPPGSRDGVLKGRWPQWARKGIRSRSTPPVIKPLADSPLKLPCGGAVVGYQLTSQANTPTRVGHDDEASSQGGDDHVDMPHGLRNGAQHQHRFAEFPLEHACRCFVGNPQPKRVQPDGVGADENVARVGDQVATLECQGRWPRLPSQRGGKRCRQAIVVGAREVGALENGGAGGAVQDEERILRPDGEVRFPGEVCETNAAR